MRVFHYLNFKLELSMAAKKEIDLSPLVSAFLKAADNRDIETHEIKLLGIVGIKKLSIAARDEWVAEKGNSSTCLLQNAVCDPATGELVLQKIERTRLAELPTDVVDELIEKIFKHNGIKTQKEMNQQQSQELKNSEASQS